MTSPRTQELTIPVVLHDHRAQTAGDTAEYMTDYDEQLDARGLSCPLPILKAKKRLYELGPGRILRVLADDPGSVKDFQAFSRQTGNELVEFQELEDHYLFVLRKSST